MRQPFFTLAITVVVSLGVAGAAFGQLASGGVGVGVSLDVETIVPKRIGGPGASTLRGTFTTAVAPTVVLSYSAKFLCGSIPPAGHPELGFPLAPGTYMTAINLHNPHPFGVKFRKKALITNPQGEPPGRVGHHVDEGLEPNHGLEVDCKNIAALLGADVTGFLKGFVVITTPHELDVVGVYTLKNVEALRTDTPPPPRDIP